MMFSKGSEFGCNNCGATTVIDKDLLIANQKNEAPGDDKLKWK